MGLLMRVSLYVQKGDVHGRRVSPFKLWIRNLIAIEL
jgi:hypothetical protein